MWMIYCEQANAGANYNTVLNNIASVNDAIIKHFNSGLHNIFYRNYCGGNGGNGYSSSVIAEHLAQEWRALTLTKDATSGLTTATENFKNRPFGWVYFNFVASNTTVQENIKDIIRHNATYKLNRNRNQNPAKAPNGDTKGVTNGGNLF